MHSQPWAPACRLSGATDGWLIDRGGPLMISVANDLLNNSLGLCCGTDGRPITYMDMLTGSFTHLCTNAFICTLNLQKFKYLWTHIPSPCLSHLLLTPRLLHVSAALVARYHYWALPLSGEKKVTRNSYLFSSWPSPLISFFSVNFFFVYVLFLTFSVCVCILNTTVKLGAIFNQLYSQVIDHLKWRSAFRVYYLQ